MRKREFYWSLFQKQDRRQIDDLRSDQLEAVFEVLSKEQKNDWLVWRDGFNAWKEFMHFPELLLGLRKVKEEADWVRPSPPVQVPAKASKKEVTKVSRGKTSVGAKNKSDSSRKYSEVYKPTGSLEVAPRLSDSSSVEMELELADESQLSDRDRRYPKKCEVVIWLGNSALKNQAVNVSSRGMELRDPLPAGLPTFFNVDIQIQGRLFKLVCSALKSGKGDPSMRLKIDVNHQAKAFMSAILAT
jgi:hypothetical protein